MLTDFQILQFLVRIHIARNLYGVISQAIFACMTFKCEQIYYLVLNLCVLLKFMFTGKAVFFFPDFDVFQGICRQPGKVTAQLLEGPTEFPLSTRLGPQLKCHP